MNNHEDGDLTGNAVNEHKKKDGKEIQIPMPWGQISGKWWGPADKQPIIALHGWQDNAGTFDNLLQLLPSNIAILSIDMPGHGFSSHLQCGDYYYMYWDGVITLRRIVKHYKWDKVSEQVNVIQRSESAYLKFSKWWGSKELQPILALHGRQDNAGSFDTLMPLLPNDIPILCLDMPGHGFSSHYPKSQFYYVYWDGIIFLRRVIKYFKWNKVKLLGHSLGGAISFLYAASYPDEVDFLISLDIVSPVTIDNNKVSTKTGEYVDKFLKYELLTLDNVPCYKYDEMIDIVVDAYHGSVTRDAAKILMKRGMQPARMKDRYYFSRDPKLKVAALGMLSLDLTLQYASQIKCAYLNIRALPGLRFDQPENYQKVLNNIKLNARKFEYREVEGTHHVHLTEPEKIAPIIINFLQNL